MMARRRSQKPSSPPAAAKTTLSLRRARAADSFELVHPPCARERADDVAEVQAMLEAGENEIALDELRWLLEECPDLLDAHRLLGEIALEQGDIPLARGHFGYAYTIGSRAAEALPPGGTLPHALAANQGLHESAKGLAWCLHEMGKNAMASDVVGAMLRWDPSDPLGVRAWLDAWIVTPGPSLTPDP